MIEYLTQLDIQLFSFINSHHNSFFDAFFLVVSWLGSGWVAVPLVTAAVVRATPRTRLARTLLCAAIAGVVAGAANTQIKRVVQRPRPIAFFEKQAVGAADTVHCVGSRLRSNSFPSGHTTTAFTAAALLSLLYRGYFLLAFLPALLVAFSRVYMGVHFPVDVLGGAVIGSAVALIVHLFFRTGKGCGGRVHPC
jgi:undecaprenyl-diphosphatase